MSGTMTEMRKTLARSEKQKVLADPRNVFFDPGHFVTP